MARHGIDAVRVWSAVQRGWWLGARHDPAEPGSWTDDPDLAAVWPRANAERAVAMRGIGDRVRIEPADDLGLGEEESGMAMFGDTAACPACGAVFGIAQGHDCPLGEVGKATARPLVNPRVNVRSGPPALTEECRCPPGTEARCEFEGCPRRPRAA
jgi:hypothetical protein